MCAFTDQGASYCPLLCIIIPKMIVCKRKGVILWPTLSMWIVSEWTTDLDSFLYTVALQNPLLRYFGQVRRKTDTDCSCSRWRQALVLSPSVFIRSQTGFDQCPQTSASLRQRPSVRTHHLPVITDHSVHCASPTCCTCCSAYSNMIWRLLEVRSVPDKLYCPTNSIRYTRKIEQFKKKQTKHSDKWSRN